MMHWRILGLLMCMFGCAGTAPRPSDASATSNDPLAHASAQQLFDAGQALAKQADLIRAEQYLSAAIERGFARGRALPLLMRVCIAGSRLASALQYATPYLQQHPQDHELRYLVAAVHVGLEHHEQARTELLHVLDDAPDFAPAHYLLAILLRDELHDKRAAREHFVIHQRLAPGSPHGAEIAAWLREEDRAQAAAPKRAVRSAPVRP